MSSRTSFRSMSKFRLPLVIALIFCLAGPGLSGEPAPQKAKPEVSPPSLGVREPGTAENLFAEAQKLAPKDSSGAIRLYRRGLILKPDARAERRKLAMLCEEQKQWSAALAEYEAIHREAGSVESSADVIRVMDKAGYPRSAAVAAQKAFAAHPGHPEFLYSAGEHFLKAGAESEAADALQKYAKLKPEDGRAFLLLGTIHEKANRPVDAYRTYLRAEKLMKDENDQAGAIRRLQAKTSTIGGLTLFLPPGWSAGKEGLVNDGTGERVTVKVSAGGDPAVLSLQSAAEAMPQGLFSAENLKRYEQFKTMRQEMAKADPTFAQQIACLSLPFFRTGDVAGIRGAKMALLSTSETIQPGMESAAAVAVPSDGRIYTFSWKAALPAQEGEKTLVDLFSRIVWPLQ